MRILSLWYVEEFLANKWQTKTFTTTLEDAEKLLAKFEATYKTQIWRIRKVRG